MVTRTESQGVVSFLLLLLVALEPVCLSVCLSGKCQQGESGLKVQLLVPPLAAVTPQEGLMFRNLEPEFRIKTLLWLHVYLLFIPHFPEVITLEVRALNYSV